MPRLPKQEDIRWIAVSSSKVAGAGAAGSAAIAAPAIAQSQPKISWRLTSSYPKSLDTLYGISTQVAKRVAEATDGNFQIQVFAPGEIVPGLQALDAVQNGTVKCSHTLSSFYIGKNPAFAFETSLPFGFHARQQNAVGSIRRRPRELCRAFMEGLQTFTPSRRAIPARRWAAGSAKEIKSLEDPKWPQDAHCRAWAGRSCLKLGVVLPRGSPAATSTRRWSGARSMPSSSPVPCDDGSSASSASAKYYYYPGFWEERECQLPREPRRSGTPRRPSYAGDPRSGLR